MSRQKPQIYEFDNFRLDVGERLLRRNGQAVPLPAKAFDLLVVLIENRGRLLEKDELYRKVWADQIVEESNLTVQMSAIRKALGEQRQNPRYIVTIPGHGYRFIADILQPDAGREVVVETETLAHLVIEKEIEHDNDANPSPAPLEIAQGHGISGTETDFITAGAMVETLPEADRRLSAPTPSRQRTSVSRWWLKIPTHRAALLGIGVLAAVGLALLTYALWSKRTPSPSQIASANRIKSIAVLPFKPLVTDNRDESFEMGMADTLIAHLSNIREINVRPISAVRKYSGLEQDALAAGREQQVDAVLDGQIQKSGEKIRVTVRLVRVEDGAPLWSSQFDEQMTDIFRVQDSIAERVSGVLAVKLTSEEKRQLTKHQTDNTEAYQLYMIGRLHFGKRTEKTINKAIGYFNQAIAKDPNYAQAYAALAAAYGTAAWYEFIAPHEAYTKAREAAVKALQIDDTFAEAHAVLGNIKRNYDWDLAGAESEYKRAIEIDPNNATAYHWYGIAMAFVGRNDEAIAMTRRAAELDPVSAVINNAVGDALFFARQHEQAIAQYEKVLGLDPNFAGAHFHMGENYYFLNKYPEAVAELLKGEIAAGSSPQKVAALRAAYESSGFRGYWQKSLELLQQSSNAYKSPYNIAYLYAALGDREHAFEWLERALKEHDPGMIALKADVMFASLRTDPRFADLLRRIGLPQ